MKGLKIRLLNALRYSRHDHRSIFRHIFENRDWGDEESVSGMGSRMAQTESIRRELPRIIEQYDIKKMFDAPCGDLNWMRFVLAQTSVDYHGGDIVAEVVELARKSSPNLAQFSIFDITSDEFPAADLWVCRDILLHLSYANIWKALENFCRSKVRMMLVTTYNETAVNRDIWTGDYRSLDLHKAPFSLPPTLVLDRFPDYSAPAPARDMILIRREDLARHLSGRLGYVREP